MEFCFHITYYSRTLVFLMGTVPKVDHTCHFFGTLEEGMSC